MTRQCTVFICLCAALGLVKAGLVSVAPAAPVLAKIENFDATPQYTFAYDVQDAITGDSKAQYETRNGDIVQGSYSLIEADGTRRIVDYTADPINGFNAIVNREPAVAPVVAKTVVAPAPVVAAAPAKYIAKSVVAAPAPVVAAPAYVRSFYSSGPVTYNLPKAVASRLSVPVVSPYTYVTAR